ncbi:MAG: hypothetical protein QFE16_11600 [Pseudomonadota bacterium]|nr:hypothetical protein [Pseudomonadota bacterium]
MNTQDDASSVKTAAAARRNRKPLWVFLAIVGGGLAIGGTLRAVEAAGQAKALPDLLGKAQPAVPAGALQVKDLESDPKGFKGSILVRGVVAKVSPQDPKLVGLIDSREARVCRDLNCANYYLPTRVDRTDLRPWDEVDVRGTMTEDARMVYLKTDKIVNLGSIKK